MAYRMVLALMRKTDYGRWSDLRSIEGSWEPRTRLIASFVPAKSRVIEFGAGTRRLENYLDPSCHYVPSDIVDRGPGTFICDLNSRPLPALDDYDTAVLIGVLEYLQDVPAVLDWLLRSISHCAVTYVCARTEPSRLAGLQDALTRVRMGWMNSYREQDLVSLFQARGFARVKEATWNNNRVFLFSREQSSSDG
jgi:hypothetical protein